METELKEILELIAALKDNGSNTAAQVREVLIKMANYKAEGANGFEIASSEVVTNDIQNYHYSFKGTDKQCCNAFIMLRNKSTPNDTTGGITNGAGFLIEISQVEYETLRNFIPDFEENNTGLLYCVPVFSNISEAQPRNLGIYLQKEGDKFYINVVSNLGPGEMISTAIALNFKEFKVEDIPDLKRNKTYIKAMDTIRTNVVR